MVTAKSAQQRGEQSVQRQAVQDQIEAIKTTLATIKARPLAQVSALLSYTKDPVRIDVLNMELAEAQRAAKLRDELVVLSATQTTNVSVADAVTDLVMRVSGMSEAVVTLSVNLVTALLLELIGVMLWLEVLGHKAEAEQKMQLQRDAEPALTQQRIAPVPHQVAVPLRTVVTPIAPQAQSVVKRESIAKSDVESVIVKDIDYTNSEIEINLMQAMISGECVPTVSGIRQYLNCSQSVAVNIQQHMADWIKSLDLDSVNT
jgi:hypothetical protein